MSKGVLIDLNIIQDHKCIKNKKVVVWGAGAKGKYVVYMLKKANISVSYVCDSNVELWGIRIEDRVVISPFELCYTCKKTHLCVILCTAFPNNRTIRKMMDQMMDVKYEYITYFGIINLFRFHYKTLFSSESIKCLFDLEKSIGRLEYQKRQIHTLSAICKIGEGDILLFQPGKVASSSVKYNLMKEGCVAYHVHHLGFPENILHDEWREKWEKVLGGLRSKKIKVISGVREPISRDISALFQPFIEDNKSRRGDWIFETGDIYKGFEQYTDIIMHCNYEPWPNGVPEVWGDEFLWFDKEIKALWGIDIYQYPFDKKKGYTVIHSEKVDIFLYKSEKLNEVSDKLYQFALGRSVLQFVSENKTEFSWRNEAYQEFKRNVVLNPDYVDHYYKDNKRMNHFYTEEEKKIFLKRWENQIGPKI